MLVMDEPTNDLDTESLELLEERLVDYEGTVLVVSHDRSFLDNMVTSTIVFEQDGIKVYVGGYDDWLRQRQSGKKAVALAETNRKTTVAMPASKSTSSQSEYGGESVATAKKMSFKEKHELEKAYWLIDLLEHRVRKPQVCFRGHFNGRAFEAACRLAKAWRPLP